MLGLAGKVAIVTGAATTIGIGRSSVLQLARAGARAIYALDLRDTHFKKLIEDVGRVAPQCKVITCRADAGVENDIKSICQRSLREFGRLDVFVANAGFVDMKNLWHTEVSDFTKSHATMVLGPFLGIKYGARAMAKLSSEKKVASGSIVVIGSIASATGGCGSPAYTAAKHAALGLARRGAIELAGTRIRVNCVGPGVTKTALWQNSRDIGAIDNDEPEGYRGDKDANKPDFIQQISEPDDIANVVTFLASDASVAINAQLILADRGHLEQTNMTWTSQATYCGVEQPPQLENQAGNV